MSSQYDPEADAAYFRFSDHPVLESQEVSEGVVFDFDEDGKIVGIELLGASGKLPEDALTDPSVERLKWVRQP